MQAAIADLVFPIFRDGLLYRARVLARSKTLTIQEARANLRRQLSTSQDPAFTGGIDDFLGIKYALVCWLDELFVTHTPWGDEWNNSLLEIELFKSRDRAWKFWAQARLAEQLGQADALEVFYLCVMLGFRGDPPAELNLEDWRQSLMQQFDPERPDECPLPPGRPPPVNAPPRVGRELLQRAVLIAVGTLIALIVPLSVFAFVQLMTSQ